MVLLYDEHFCDTIITGNIDISSNSILEIRDSILASIHIGIHVGGAKYRIYSIKT